MTPRNRKKATIIFKIFSYNDSFENFFKYCLTTPLMQLYNLHIAKFGTSCIFYQFLGGTDI